MSEAKQKAEVRKIKMSDGREVEFAGKRRMLKEVIVEGGQTAVRFDYDNGNTSTYPVPGPLAAYSAGHGLAQKLGDEVAGLKNEDGSAVDTDDIQLAVEELYERLKACAGPDWKMVREGGGFGGASVLMKALIEFSGNTAEQIKAFLAGKDQTAKMALRENDVRKGKTGETLKQIVTRLEQAKKAKVAAVNTDEMLDTLPAA